ncbi:hypothetical protein F5880DRAFT_338010 [Lentinula raphanica]|nr:hypothetical protein F5880DRAFT_338010 [Lentinula raphanica]
MLAPADTRSHALALAITLTLALVLALTFTYSDSHIFPLVLTFTRARLIPVGLHLWMEPPCTSFLAPVCICACSIGWCSR